MPPLHNTAFLPGQRVNFSVVPPVASPYTALWYDYVVPETIPVGVDYTLKFQTPAGNVYGNLDLLENIPGGGVKYNALVSVSLVLWLAINPLVSTGYAALRNTKAGQIAQVRGNTRFVAGWCTVSYNGILQPGDSTDAIINLDNGLGVDVVEGNIVVIATQLKENP
jgi:hypothetical protein